MLLVISESALRYIETAIVDAAREARDTGGNLVMVPTIDARKLRQAAKFAIGVALSEDIWDASETLTVVRPRRQAGFVNIEES